MFTILSKWFQVHLSLLSSTPATSNSSLSCRKTPLEPPPPLSPPPLPPPGSRVLRRNMEMETQKLDTFATQPKAPRFKPHTVEPLIMDTLKSGQPPYNGQTVCPLPNPYISTSEEGTTSEQWTKCSSPMCPLFGGSTVCSVHKAQNERTQLHGLLNLMATRHSE